MNTLLFLGNLGLGEMITLAVLIIIPAIVIGVITIAIIRLLWRLGNKKKT